MRLRRIVMVVPAVEVETFDAFCSIGDYLRSQSIPAPAIHGPMARSGNRSSRGFWDQNAYAGYAVGAGEPSCSPEDAIGLLVRLHACRPHDAFPCPAFQLQFDEEKWRFEYRFHVRDG